MKSYNTRTKTICGAVAMVVLILDAQTALYGCAEGINLCLRSVIPALFPFLICSIYMTGNLGNRSVSLLSPIGRLCRIPPGSEGILLTGFLGGYPVGAQSIAQAYEAGNLSLEDARRMLGFCSNAGPAFIFGMLSPSFSGANIPWILWMLQILSAMITGILLPGGGNYRAALSSGGQCTVPQAVSRAVRTMANVCGWVIAFRTVNLFLDRWFLWMLPKPFCVLLTGLLELANGCANLSSVENDSIRFLLAALLLSAGGLCVGMQTVSVTGTLGTGYYFPGKLVQTCICALLCGLILPFLYSETALPWLIPGSLIAILLSMYSLGNRKNNSSNFHLHGV